ncbi:MAG: YiiX/YebB-like N1pC/P60 family cysteine hydrolase [Patescibacteria group bacterium]|nr:YiiX/YebB-like N1pC/P60 family cysteine hydrolase [Patescibacteria group bacterium]
MKSTSLKIHPDKLKHDPLKNFPLEKINGPLPDLKIGDIILVRHKRGGPMRFFLRRITDSYWDHTALVIFAKSFEKGYAANIIVEAIQHGLVSSFRQGVQIHRLEKYLSNPDKYDVGIKRFGLLNEELRNRVRAFVLMNIDTPYYPLYTFKFFLAWLSKSYCKLLLNRQRFSCSGFIQKAFYEAVDWDDRSKVIFRNVGYTPIQLQDITNPADVAASASCEWIWNERQ